MTELAMRKNDGKPELRYILCFPKAIKALAITCMIGAAKYVLYNFMKPTPVSRSYDCLQRHLTDLWNGELVDAEGNPHAGAIVFNALQIAENVGTDTDDRPCMLVEGKINVTRE